MSTKRGRGFTFNLPGGAARPFDPCQLRHWYH